MTIPTRAAWLRALALERERLANHLGDLGYLGNDGGFAFGLAQFSRLKEDVLRTNLVAFGHRLVMDHVVPGGVARDLAPEHAAQDQRRMRDAGARDPDHPRHLRRARRPAGPLPHLRHRAARAGGEARPDRHGRTRQRPGTRPALRFSGRALRFARRAQGRIQRRRRRRARRRALRRSAESLRLIQNIVKAIPGGEIHAPLPDGSGAQAGAGLSSKAGADRCCWRSPAVPAEQSAAAIRTIRPGRTGRCSNTRSSATSFPTSR